MKYLFVGLTYPQAILFRDLYCEVKKIPRSMTTCLTWSTKNRFDGLHPNDHQLVLCGQEMETQFHITRKEVLNRWEEQPVEIYRDIDELQSVKELNDAG